MRHYRSDLPKPELVIGLVGPAGTDLTGVSTALLSALKPYDYKTYVIKVSKLIAEKCSDGVRNELDDCSFERRVEILQDEGDKFRAHIGYGGALVPLICSRIRFVRQNFLKEEGCLDDFDEVELYNHCFIVDSIKHPDEINMLRNIYGEKFILISCFSDYEDRRNFLRKEISKYYKTTRGKSYDDKIDVIIETDYKRQGTKLGQDVSSSFHAGDMFLYIKSDWQKRVEKFLRQLFDYPYITPNKHELSMFSAFSASLRSSDLSRQVGVAICNEHNELLVTGCNEVPQVGGGSFWEGDSGIDNRDWVQGRDFNAIKKLDIIQEFVNFLEDEGIDFTQLGNMSVDKLGEELISGSRSGKFSELRIANLIEFGRVVHAEMHAICEASRRGISINKSVLYSTTFPCHMCARHIIAAGITQVYYIEPYPKSLATEIYEDEISLEASRLTTKVVFSPYEGIAPRYFGRIFSASKRKDSAGYALEWKKSEALPKFIDLSNAHIARELSAAMLIEDAYGIEVKDDGNFAKQFEVDNVSFEKISFNSRRALRRELAAYWPKDKMKSLEARVAK